MFVSSKDCFENRGDTCSNNEENAVEDEIFYIYQFINYARKVDI